MIDAQEYQRRVAEEVKQYESWRYEELLDERYGFENKQYGADYNELLNDDEEEMTVQEEMNLKQIYIDMCLKSLNFELENNEDYQEERARSDYYDNQRREGLYE